MDPMIDWTDEDFAEYERWANHHHVIQETPDGMGCVICIYG